MLADPAVDRFAVHSRSFFDAIDARSESRDGRSETGEVCVDSLQGRDNCTQGGGVAGGRFLEAAEAFIKIAPVLTETDQFVANAGQLRRKPRIALVGLGGCRLERRSRRRGIRGNRRIRLTDWARPLRPVSTDTARGAAVMPMAGNAGDSPIDREALRGNPLPLHALQQLHPVRRDLLAIEILSPSVAANGHSGDRRRQTRGHSAPALRRALGLR